MEKKSTGLKVLVIILSILVIGLGGYIVYDKSSNNNLNLNNNDILEKEPIVKNIKDIFAVGYDTVVFVNDNNIYYTHTQENGFFWDHELTKTNTNNLNVSKVRLFSIGLDPAQTIFVISEEGQTYKVNEETNTLETVIELEKYQIKDIKSISVEMNNDEIENRYSIVMLDGTEKVIKK